MLKIFAYYAFRILGTCFKIIIIIIIIRHNLIACDKHS